MKKVIVSVWLMALMVMSSVAMAQKCSDEDVNFVGLRDAEKWCGIDPAQRARMAAEAEENEKQTQKAMAKSQKENPDRQMPDEEHDQSSDFFKKQDESRRLMAYHKNAVDGFKPLSKGKILGFCGEFRSASIAGNIQSILSRISDGGYFPEEVFSRVECRSDRLNNANIRIPMMQIAVENIDSRDKFVKEIYDYFQVIKQNASWLKVVNAKNTKDMTFMDYTKFVHDEQKNDGSENLKNKYRGTFAFACSHGGTMSYYKDYDCSKGIEQVGLVAK